MAYDVLSEDLFVEDKKPKSKKKPNKKKFKIKPIHLHIFVVILVIILIFFISSKGLDMISFGNDEKGEITIIGDLTEFSESYNGDLLVESAKFTLKTNSNIINEISKDILLNDFSGTILYDNETIVISGISSLIEYGNNDISTNGNNFVLTSSQNTKINLYYDTLDLNLDKATIKLDKDFKHDLKNGSITLNEYNFTMVYDGTFSFSGKSKSFVINSPLQNLEIKYLNNNISNEQKSIMTE